MNSGKGSEAATGEIPWPSRPISSIVVIPLGGEKLKCFLGLKISFSILWESSMRDRGNRLVGRVAFLVVGPTTVGGKGRKSAIEGISESIEGKW